MNIELVRKIDYWIGIPACFLLTVLNFAGRVLKAKPERIARHPRRFLVIELSEMGSAILAYPTMWYLKTRYADVDLFFMIFEKNRASVDVLDIVPEENVLAVRSDSLLHFFGDVIKNLIRLRREKIDVAFDLELFARATAVLTYLSGAPKRVGFYKYNMEGLYRGNFMTHKVQYNFQQHISKSFFSFLKVMDSEHKDSPEMDSPMPDQEIEPGRFVPKTKDIEGIWQKLQSLNPAIGPDSELLVFNPSGGDLPIRAWPFENYVDLAKKILDSRPRSFIIVIGGPDDMTLAREFEKRVGGDRCINMAGRTTIAELLHLYNVAHVLVSNDSGPAHFASLTGIRRVVFFGPETPILYAPLGNKTTAVYSGFPCSPCLTAYNHRNTACRDNKCLKAIRVDEVYELVESELRACPDEDRIAGCWGA